MDQKVQVLATAIAVSAESACAMNAICADALPHVFMSAIAMMLRCAAAYRAGGSQENPCPPCDDEFDGLLLRSLMTLDYVTS